MKKECVILSRRIRDNNRASEPRVVSKLCLRLQLNTITGKLSGSSNMNLEINNG